MGIGSHQSAKAKTIEWLTPPEIVEALGPFDLDPCSPLNRPWDTARHHYSLPAQNGLALPWFGRVWLNPPYGKLTGRWLQRMVEHGSGVALIFARTETRMFFEYVWNCASAVLFVQGRPHFHLPDGSRAKANSGGPICLIGYGQGEIEKLETSGIPGKVIVLRRRP